MNQRGGETIARNGRLRTSHYLTTGPGHCESRQSLAALRSTFGLLLCLSACSSPGDLSRSAAAKLLSDRGLAASTSTLRWTQGGFAAYVAHGGAHNRDFSAVVESADQSRLTLMKPFSVKVNEVTGIADLPMGPGVKELQFSWLVDDVSELLFPYVSETGTGAAVVRRYDDGWRVEEIGELKPDPEPAVTAADVVRIEKYTATEAARRDSESRAAEELLRASKSATTELLKGPLRIILGAYMCCVFDAGEFVLSDVDLTLNLVEQPARKVNDGGLWPDEYAATPARRDVVWFGCVGGFYEGAMPGSTDHSRAGNVLVGLRGGSSCGPGDRVNLTVSSVAEAKRVVEIMNRALQAWNTKYQGLQTRR